MSRLCTICVRGGSRGVPGKNRRLVAGKPLFAWSVDQALATGAFDQVAISTDDPKIIAMARARGDVLVIERPAELATDTSGKLDAIVHAVRAVEEKLAKRFTTVVDLDATSPLRSVDDIMAAVELQQRESVTNVITGAKARRSPYFNQVERGPQGFVGLSKPPAERILRRQDAPEVFDMNASIYVWNRDALLENPGVFYVDTMILEMPEDRSIDIDTELDFEFVTFLMARRHAGHRGFIAAHDLSGKRAVVTGAAGILGRHFCRALAEHGANLVLLDASAATLDALRDDLRAVSTGQVEALPVDVADPGAVEAVVGLIEAEMGPIDILHNNAATKGPDLRKFFEPAETFDPELWRHIMDVNVSGYFFMARAVGSRMAARGKGSIIQTASIYGVVAPDQRIYEGSEYLGMGINTPAVYSASKSAVLGLSKYFASYWGASGVRVNTLTPGGVRSGQNGEFERRYSNRVPLNRMAEPEEIAHALVFLASDASSYISGQNIIVDGGLTAW
jgi:NAD(P)-dependent dehydrogenase (short-subunit alcohol dehydrogenase family)